MRLDVRLREDNHLPHATRSGLVRRSGCADEARTRVGEPREWLAHSREVCQPSLTVTLILAGSAGSVSSGRRTFTVRTPLSYSAVTASGVTPSGTGIRLSNFPNHLSRISRSPSETSVHSC